MSAEPAGLDAAVVGAGSLLGQEIRRQVAARRLPLRTAVLMGDGEEVGQIFEMNGEACLVTDLDEDRLGRADVLFLAARSAAARRAAAAAERGRGLTIDLVDAGGGAAEPVINMDVNAGDLPAARPARVRSPHQAAYLLTSVLRAVAGDSPIEAVDATAVTPVSDAGEPGVEELYRQTTGVLSFGDQPRGVFERQLAFNIVPHALMHRQQGWPDLDVRLRAETSAVLGISPRRVSVRALLAPIFHGLALAASVRLESPGSAARRRRRLQQSGFVIGPMTPAELGESEAVHVLDMGEEEDGAVALWIVADNLRSGMAANAVRIAEAALAGSREASA